MTIQGTFRNAVIIIGGSGFSIYPKLLFETLKPDFGIYGEGEDKPSKTHNQLLKASRIINKIEGLLYMEDSGSCSKQKKQLLSILPVLSF